MSPSRGKKSKKRPNKKRFDQGLIEALVVLAVFLIIISIGPALKLYQDTYKAKPAINDVLEIKNAAAQSNNQAMLKTYHQPIPVLMFHHIRDYDNPADPIDTVISTPVNNFKSEMLTLRLNGYTTITFKDLLNGDIPKKPILVTFDDGYNDNFQNAYMTLKANGQVGTFFIIADFVNGTNYLSAREIKIMSQNGMEIGDHTETHPDLTKSSAADLKYQIAQSKRDLEAITKKRIIAFCYPYGDLDAQVESFVAANGYKFAVTTQDKAGSNDLFEMPRIPMNPGDSGYNLIAKINNFLDKNSQISWDY